MKHILLFITVLFMSLSLFAQTPEKLPYTAVIKTVDNEVVPDSEISLKIILRKGNPSGPIIYEEDYLLTTDNLSIISIEIGSGTPVQGDFNTIAWEDGINYIQTKVDATGGTNYVNVSVNQLLSVPYALHAKSADFVSGYLPTPYVAEIIPFISTRNVNTNDIGNTIECTTSSTLNIQANFSEMEIGDYINVEAHNGAILTIVGGTNVTLNYVASGTAIFGSEVGTVRFGLLRKSGTNAYIVSGQP